MRCTHAAVSLITVAIAALAPTASTVASAASAPAAPIKVTATIRVGRFPVGVAADPRTNTIYVANTLSNTVSVISGRTNTVTATIRVGR